MFQLIDSPLHSIRASIFFHLVPLSRLYDYDIAFAQDGDSRLIIDCEMAIHNWDKVYSCFYEC